MFAQVHFRRAAGAFDEHDVGFPFQAGIAIEHEPGQIRLHALISSGVRRSVNATLYYDLCAHLTLWLKQHWIHMHARRSACRSCLESLRSANLAAVDSHRRVVGHVLRLEWPDVEAPICQARAMPVT